MFTPGLLLSLLFAVSHVTPSPVGEPSFDLDTIDKVVADAFEISNHSWELGTECEAFIELYSPSLSVFYDGAFPPPRTLDRHLIGNTTAMIDIATHVVQTKEPGTLPLIDGDGAVGDPASLGVAVLLANWTRTNESDQSFSVAAQDQLVYLLENTLRTSDGAISHRVSEVQLWADFVYMAPPFIAYYGIFQGGSQETALLQEAYDQCRLYRNYLRDDSGLWKHIVLGDTASQDFRHWGTGNAWAAAGMMRVLQTIRHSSQAWKFESQRADLTSWISEIVSATWAHQHENGTLFNVIDDDTTFPDSSSTALLAATTYRLAALTKDYAFVPAAQKALHLIKQNVDTDGWLHDTVDPETFFTASPPGTFSPEGQSFVLLLQAAWRDFTASLV
ncbi:hypothetical protein PHLGIDRAFT_27123 [Phlebiopsis gigantea 11061_1 CR5-6]|uniref:Glycoside hydrolase family 105 protein n=1 Tax=Phlebiopsis gigantea (strain 11061_1 CR5-6) TaxID=745531 RepID=A0A0C3S7Y3_PHLG1|nr:hypothetical protein PHLGIDRAFT_27123 [Phlebiopsis gigantea 11061_1 CR5-6]